MGMQSPLSPLWYVLGATLIFLAAGAAVGAYALRARKLAVLDYERRKQERQRKRQKVIADITEVICKTSARDIAEAVDADLTNELKKSLEGKSTNIG